MPRCQNKYTTLLDLARQAKIISGNTACFDGKIAAGIPFSGYPTGVDLSTVINLGVISQEDAVFSGNTGTTIFFFTTMKGIYILDSFRRYLFV